jgi:hypothetical protein
MRRTTAPLIVETKQNHHWLRTIDWWSGQYGLPKHGCPGYGRPPALGYQVPVLPRKLAPNATR